MPNKLLDAALWYAEHGWAVMPLHTPRKEGCSCIAGESCESIGKHPRTERGVYDATTDAGTIKDWWRQWPDANVGLAAGSASGVIVIDVDPRNGGKHTLENLDERPPMGLVASTGGGGWHFYAAYQEGRVKSPGKGIDLKSDGGLVVLPPSLHSSGKRYRWRSAKSLKQMRLGELPSWAIAEGGSSARSKGKTTSRDKYLRSGGRNDGLVKEAGRIRRLGYDEPIIRSALQSFNRMWCEPPLDEREVAQIARSVMRYAPAAEELKPQTGEFPINYHGYAQRLEVLHGPDIRFYEPRKAWFEWTGKVWAEGRKNHIRRRALDIVAALRDEMEEADEKLLKKYEAAINTVQSPDGLDKILAMAEALPGIEVDASVFDVEPWLFNVQNGTVDLRTGKLRPHSREDFITKMAPVYFDAKARAPRFLQFLDETFEGDQELIDYVQKLFGYCLSGSVIEQIFPVCWGKGANGKSALFEHAILSVMGRDYMVRLSADTLLDKRFSAHPTELMDLRGARLAVAVESGRRRSLDEEVIKSLTGGDTIKARRMHRDPEEFSPTHKLILVTNNKPRASASEAIWRRLRLIPFTRMVPPELRDPNLGDKLEAEASGILNWLIDGCIAWQEDGLNEPERVMDTTSAHREDQDLIGAFFREAVVFDSKAKCAGDDLYRSYLLWAEQTGVRASGKISFNREIAERYQYVKKYNSGGKQRWRGLKPRVLIKSSQLSRK